jgi:hypothetical protein
MSLPFTIGATHGFEISSLVSQVRLKIIALSPLVPGVDEDQAMIVGQV